MRASGRIVSTMGCVPQASGISLIVVLKENGVIRVRNVATRTEDVVTITELVEYLVQVTV